MVDHRASRSERHDSDNASGGDDRSQQDFVRLLIEHERRLEGFILAMVADWAVAEDIAQETKLRLWEQFDQYVRGQDFGAWARTIAYYQVLSHRKRQTRSREQLFGDDFLQQVAKEEATCAEEILSRQRFLATCLEKLSEKSRELLKLVYSGKETMRQIARRLGRGESAMYTAVQDARLRLHACIENELRKDRVE